MDPHLRKRTSKIVAFVRWMASEPGWWARCGLAGAGFAAAGVGGGDLLMLALMFGMIEGWLFPKDPR
jgi:hypothetical protein